VSRGIALLFSRTFGTRWGWGSAQRPGHLYPRERPGTHCTGGKSRPHRDSILLFSRTFGTRWGVGVSPTPRPPLPPGKTRYPLYGRKISSPPGFDPGPPGHSQSLYRLSYPAAYIAVHYRMRITRLSFLYLYLQTPLTNEQ